MNHKINETLVRKIDKEIAQLEGISRGVKFTKVDESYLTRAASTVQC